MAGLHPKVSDEGTTEVPPHIASQELKDKIHGINEVLVADLLDKQTETDSKDDPDDTGEFMPFALANELEGTSDFEIPLADDGTWTATHKIGDTLVMEKRYTNAMRYWLQEDGQRRRPSARNPLMPIIDLPSTSQRIRIPLSMLGLISEALEHDFAEDAYGNIVNKIDEDHVYLSIYSQKTFMHTKYILSVVDYVELVGKEL